MEDRACPPYPACIADGADRGDQLGGLRAWNSDVAEQGLKFLALLVLENRLKPETVPALNVLHKASIRTVMATGARCAPRRGWPAPARHRASCVR